MTPTVDDARLANFEETFDTVMLCTTSSAGAIHARPMVVAEVDDTNCWWFVAPRKSVTCHEIEAHPYAAITMQGSSSYASVSGRAAVVARADMMKEAPPAEGIDGSVSDGDTVFICFQPTAGAIWEEGATEPSDLDAKRAKTLLSVHAVDAQRAAAHAVNAATPS